MSQLYFTACCNPCCFPLVLAFWLPIYSASVCDILHHASVASTSHIHVYVWLSPNASQASAILFSFCIMRLPPSNLSLPGGDSTKESKDEGEGSASIAMRPYADNKWDTKTINAMGLDQPRLTPGSLQRQSSPRGSIGSGTRSGWPTPGTQTGPVDVSKPKAAGTVIFWKEPSRGAKRRAKAAAAAKTAAVSPNDLDLAAQVLVSETRHEKMIQVMRGISDSDKDDDSDDNDLPDFSDLPQSDAQGAQPEVSATAEAPFAQPPTAAAPQEPQDVPDDASSSYHGQVAQPEVTVAAEAPVALPLMAAAPQEPQDVPGDASSSYPEARFLQSKSGQ